MCVYVCVCVLVRTFLSISACLACVRLLVRIHACRCACMRAILFKFVCHCCHFPIAGALAQTFARADRDLSDRVTRAEVRRGAVAMWGGVGWGGPTRAWGVSVSGRVCECSCLCVCVCVAGYRVLPEPP